MYLLMAVVCRTGLGKWWEYILLCAIIPKVLISTATSTFTTQMAHIVMVHLTQNLHFSEGSNAGQKGLKYTRNLLQSSTTFVPTI